MRKKIFVIIAVVAAVLALGVGSALAFGVPAAGDAQAAQNRVGAVTPETVGDGYGSGDCDGTCDGVAAAPEDGTGNQFGLQNNDCNDETCAADAPGYGGGVCNGTGDGIAVQPQDGTGSRYGAGNNSSTSNGTAPRDGSGRQCGRSR